LLPPPAQILERSEVSVDTGKPEERYRTNRIGSVLFPAYRGHANLDYQGGFMLYWTLVFLVVAIIAGVLGFTGVAVAAAGVAKLLFFIFLVLFVISLITHLARGRSSV
jgi:uncharacterized membrane protein YtjA (UPF0391 family)